MKTKKLIKRTAAFCLTLAGFCAAQSAFAEVTVPEWQNSFTTAPANKVAFYLYHVDSDKFTTNQLPFVDAKDATPWKNDDKFCNYKESTNHYLYVEDKVFKSGKNEKGDQAVKFQKDPNGEKWCLYFQYSSFFTKVYPVFYGNNNKIEVTNKPKSLVPQYEWYLISETQWKNHLAIEGAKKILDEANGLLSSAKESETQATLKTAVDETEVVINAVEIEVDATETLNPKIEALKQALEDFKVANVSQVREIFGETISEARDYSPMFDFLATAITAANGVYEDADATAEELDAAKVTLESVVAQAQAIVNSDAYKTYSTYISMIETSNAKATEAGYAGYDATAATTAMNAEKQNLLGISDAAGMTDINNTLKTHVEQVVRDYAYYAGAESVAGQAAKVGYTADLAAIKAATVSELPELIEGIRAEAKKGVFNYIANYEGEDPIDMTIFINNNSFEFGETGWNRGWNASYTGGNPDIGARWNYLDYATIGCDGSYLYNTWKEYYGNSAGFGVYQYITGLPNGKYKLEALLTSDPGNKIYLTVDAEKNKQTRVGEGVISENGKGEFVEASCEFYVNNMAITIGAIGEQKSSLYDAWFRADNFRLTLLPATMDEDGNEKPSDYTSGDVMPVVKVTREIKANQWTTLCLPMDCAKPESLSLYEVADETQDENGGVSVTVAASSDEKIKAGKPYIVKNADAVISEFVSNGVSLVEAPKTAGEFIPFTGLFTTTELNAGDIYVSTSADNAEGDKPVYKSLSETASNKNMKGFRAYFQVPAETAESSVRFVTEGDITGIMQAIEEQQTSAGAYNLSGHKVNTLQKGIYVIDGKKIIIK